MWLDSKINHCVTVSQKKANLSKDEMPLISFYPWKGKFLPKSIKITPTR